jgi:AGZA family xanthine/uracil permease-like MFS transporter
VFLKADLLGALKLSLLPAIIAILFTDLFDSISTFMGVAHASNLLDEDGHPKNLRQGLIVDSVATFGAGLAGTSSGTAYIESIAGINSGGRTGLTSVFTALCFLPCLFIAPLAGMVPPFATAPVLLLVGAAMFKSVAGIDFRKIEQGLPAFLTIILIPLTFSITQGILWGFISHVGLYLIVGRRKEIHPVMYALAVISIGLLLLEHSNLAEVFNEKY